MLDAKVYDYVFLISGNTFSSKFISCWTQTVRYLDSKGLSFACVFSYHPIITQNRNALVGNFPYKMAEHAISLDVFDNSLTAKKVIFIDNDIIWSLDDLSKLLESDKDVVSGVYMTVDQTTCAVIDFDEKRMNIVDVVSRTEPFSVMGVGMGFVACKFEVLKKMGFPWFDIKSLIIDEKGYVTSEDLFFCARAIDKGYEIHVDPTIQLGHEKMVLLKP